MIKVTCLQILVQELLSSPTDPRTNPMREGTVSSFHFTIIKFAALETACYKLFNIFAIITASTLLSINSPYNHSS
jgi:hypothetical protein